MNKDLERMTTEERIAAVNDLLENIVELRKRATALGVKADKLLLPATAVTLAHTVSDGCALAASYAKEVRNQLLSRPIKGEQNGPNR